MKQPWSSLLQMCDEIPQSFVARTCSWPSVTTQTRQLPQRASLFVRRKWLTNCKREAGDNSFEGKRQVLVTKQQSERSLLGCCQVNASRSPHADREGAGQKAESHA